MKGRQHAEGKQGREDVHRDEGEGNGQGQSGANRAVENGASARDGQAADAQGNAASGAQENDGRLIGKGAGKALSQQAYLNVTEGGMKDALIEARGDIFIASQLLGITALRLDRAIRVSALLQATVAEIPPEKEWTSQKQIQEAIENRLALYRVAGLDALHELATMPLNDNSAQNQVKLAAAARLAGSPEAGAGGGEVGEALRALNQLYHEQAPRLRVVRERLTVEVAPGQQDISSTSNALQGSQPDVIEH